MILEGEGPESISLGVLLLKEGHDVTKMNKGFLQRPAEGVGALGSQMGSIASCQTQITLFAMPGPLFTLEQCAEAQDPVSKPVTQ